MSIAPKTLSLIANDRSDIKEVVTSLTQKYLSSKHSALQKAVSDLSSRIDKLQAQELELTSQIKNTSKVLETHPGPKTLIEDPISTKNPKEHIFAERHKYSS